MSDDTHTREGLAMDLKTRMALAGGPTKLGAMLNVDKSTFYRWRKIPPRHVPKISEAFGIPRHELRPDLWEAPQP